jgi:F-type H+-transporting ATPase subunit delta
MAERKTLARPYAKALFELARAEQALPRWSEVLARLSEIIAEPQVQRVLDSPQATVKERGEVVIAIGGEALDQQARNLVRLLSENRRLSLIPDIAADYGALKAASENTIDVELSAPVPVDEAEQTRIRQALQTRLGRDVKLHCELDESLLGGAVIRAGDLVIDGSLKSRLERLTAAMVH